MASIRRIWSKDYRCFFNCSSTVTCTTHPAVTLNSIETSIGAPIDLFIGGSVNPNVRSQLQYVGAPSERETHCSVCATARVRQYWSVPGGVHTGILDRRDTVGVADSDGVLTR